ncbi:MAG: DeoR family transcriptional regulator [Clostridia bacterium]|nr:DeoR family transcriptional regulator [Clostridia bacterium]
MYYKGRRRTEQQKRNRSVQVCEYLAEDEKHTMKDVKEEFGISKETVRRDLEYLRKLIQDGKFSNNPPFEKKIKESYVKAKNRLKANSDIAYFHRQMLIKAKLRHDLLNKS